VNVAYLGNISAGHFGHACHRLVSPGMLHQKDANRPFAECD